VSKGDLGESFTEWAYYQVLKSLGVVEQPTGVLDTYCDRAHLKQFGDETRHAFVKRMNEDNEAAEAFIRGPRAHIVSEMKQVWAVFKENPHSPLAVAAMTKLFNRQKRKRTVVEEDVRTNDSFREGTYYQTLQEYQQDFPNEQPKDNGHQKVDVVNPHSGKTSKAWFVPDCGPNKWRGRASASKKCRKTAEQIHAGMTDQQVDSMKESVAERVMGCQLNAGETMQAMMNKKQENNSDSEEDDGPAGGSTTSNMPGSSTTPSKSQGKAASKAGSYDSEIDGEGFGEIFLAESPIPESEVPSPAAVGALRHQTRTDNVFSRPPATAKRAAKTFDIMSEALKSAQPLVIAYIQDGRHKNRNTKSTATQLKRVIPRKPVPECANICKYATDVILPFMEQLGTAADLLAKKARLGASESIVKELNSLHQFVSKLQPLPGFSADVCWGRAMITTWLDKIVTCGFCAAKQDVTPLYDCVFPDCAVQDSSVQDVTGTVSDFALASNMAKEELHDMMVHYIQKVVLGLSSTNPKNLDDAPLIKFLEMRRASVEKNNLQAVPQKMMENFTNLIRVSLPHKVQTSPSNLVQDDGTMRIEAFSPYFEDTMKSPLGKRLFAQVLHRAETEDQDGRLVEWAGDLEALVTTVEQVTQKYMDLEDGVDTPKPNDVLDHAKSMMSVHVKVLEHTLFDGSRYEPLHKRALAMCHLVDICLPRAFEHAANALLTTCSQYLEELSGPLSLEDKSPCDVFARGLTDVEAEEGNCNGTQTWQLLRQQIQRFGPIAQAAAAVVLQRMRAPDLCAGAAFYNDVFQNWLTLCDVATGERADTTPESNFELEVTLVKTCNRILACKGKSSRCFQAKRFQEMVVALWEPKLKQVHTMVHDMVMRSEVCVKATEAVRKDTMDPDEIQATLTAMSKRNEMLRGMLGKATSHDDAFHFTDLYEDLFEMLRRRKGQFADAEFNKEFQDIKKFAESFEKVNEMDVDDICALLDKEDCAKTVEDLQNNFKQAMALLSPKLSSLSPEMKERANDTIGFLKTLLATSSCLTILKEKDQKAAYDFESAKLTPRGISLSSLPKSVQTGLQVLLENTGGGNGAAAAAEPAANIADDPAFCCVQWVLFADDPATDDPATPCCSS